MFAAKRLGKVSPQLVACLLIALYTDPSFPPKGTHQGDFPRPLVLAPALTLTLAAFL